MKIRPNDPCPCGSGKKYKKCCKIKGEFVEKDYGSKVYQYMRAHNSAEILNIVVALQLNPENRGANIRMERLARYAALTMHDGGDPVDIAEFIEIVNEEFASDTQEDCPCNLFADTLSTIGGTHIIFPGIACHSAEIMQTLCDALYMRRDAWPASFMDVIRQGLMLMLMLGDLMAERAHIKGLTKGGDRRRQVLNYTGIEDDYRIFADEMNAFMKRYGISQGILDSFTIDISKKRQALLNGDSFDNPLYDQPLVKFGDSYYFLLVSNQVDALRRFILRIADICECLPLLVDSYHDIEWGAIMRVCESMEWELTDISVPDPMPNTKEFVCQIDTNWFAYVICSYDNSDDVRKDRAQVVDVGKRIGEVQTYISEHVDANKRLLIVVLTSTMGEMGGAMMNSDTDNPQVGIAVRPFIQLAKAEQWHDLDLLRFAECYQAHKDQFIPMMSMLDIYSMYKQYHYSFYMSDDKRPTMIVSDIDSGYELIQDSKIEADNHAAAMIVNRMPVSVQVVKDSKFFPVYSTVHPSYPYLACVENGQYPIWVSCKQKDTRAKHLAETYGLAILYWVYRINDATHGKGIEVDKPTEISLVFDEEAMKPMLQPGDVASTNEPYSFKQTDTGLQMDIHLNGLVMMQKADNSGERQMMIDLLNAFKGAPIGTQLVNIHIQEDMGKMILLYSVDATSMANRTELLRPRLIPESLKQQLLDLLPIWMRENGFGFDGRIIEKTAKEEALRHMVDTLLEKLSIYVKQFEYKSLLHFAVWNYESLVWKRDEKKVLDAARAYCFGVNDQMRIENNQEEQRLTQAGLSIRCLIEYLAAQPHSGGEKQIGHYELEYMMALMGEIISYGEFCDAIHLGVSDQVVECLPSGRYGIYQDDFAEIVSAFQSAYGEDMLAGQMLSFEDRFEKKVSTESSKSIYPTLEEMDAAFNADWGIGYSDIVSVCTCMSQLCVNQGKGALQIPEEEAIKEVANMSKLSEDVVAKVIERLSLQEREKYLVAPEGYKNLEVMPWGYNREFSFTRRFIVREIGEDKKAYLTFGLRNAIASYKQLTFLLMQGQLNAGEGEIKTLVGKFSEIKGNIFNNHVQDYLSTHTKLQILCDVPIMKDSQFHADKDYGDIDVLAYDKETHIAYSIECKDAVMAKNIRQMKTEIDKFLGRDEHDKKAWVVKHVGRHEWLNKHKTELVKFLGIDEVKEIKSFLLTASVLPVAFLCEKELPMPIKSYYELEKVNGDLEKLLEK